jgi:hypothetical protein
MMIIFFKNLNIASKFATERLSVFLKNWQYVSFVLGKVVAREGGFGSMPALSYTRPWFES